MREKSIDIWIFTDSQKSIDLIEKSRHFLIENIHQNAIQLKNQRIKLHIEWISGHSKILENEKADSLAKTTLSSEIITSDQFIFFKFLKNRIIESNLTQWRAEWIKNSKKKKHYKQFDIRSEEGKIRLLSSRFDKLIISTLMQM